MNVGTIAFFIELKMKALRATRFVLLNIILRLRMIFLTVTQYSIFSSLILLRLSNLFIASSYWWRPWNAWNSVRTSIRLFYYILHLLINQLIVFLLSIFRLLIQSFIYSTFAWISPHHFVISTALIYIWFKSILLFHISF